MFQPILLRRAFSEAIHVQRSLHTLCGSSVRGFCQNSTIGNSFSQLPNVFLRPLRYECGMGPYSLYPRGNVIQDPKVAKVFDVTPIPYHSHESVEGGFSHPVFHPIPGPSINACTDEVRKIASSVSPYVVNICFLKGNRVLGKGSGTIIDSGGIILTSVHLLGSERNDEAFKGSRVDIAIDRGQGNIVLSVPGVVWYADSLHGIAIIKIDCSFPLQAAKLGSVQQLCPHDVVFFAGRTRTFASQSHAQYVATEGLYISHGGSFGELLSVTCSVELGTDGGPIFNLNGEVVGVMTRKESSNSHAICIDVVSNALDYFRKHANISDQNGEGRPKLQLLFEDM